MIGSTGPATPPPVPAASPAEPPVLELAGIHAGYGQVAVLQGIDLVVRRGECVVLLGPNGVGKTTVLRVVSGIVRPTAGTVARLGEPLDRTPPHAIAALGVAHVPEGRGIFPSLTVRENLRLGTFGSRDALARESDSLEEVLALFPILREKLDQRAGALSGGQQQMLAIGRGLMGRPSLLLLDEPSLGLAPVLVEEVFNALREIKRQGTTILLVEQSAPQALRIADRGYVLNRGRVVLEGRAADVAEGLREAYLG